MIRDAREKPCRSSPTTDHGLRFTHDVPKGRTYSIFWVSGHAPAHNKSLTADTMRLSCPGDSLSTTRLRPGLLHPVANQADKAGA